MFNLESGLQSHAPPDMLGRKGMNMLIDMDLVARP